MKRPQHLRVVSPKEKRVSKHEYSVSASRTMDLWGSKIDYSRAPRPRPQVEFWARYFSPVEAKRLANADFRTLQGTETIKDRLLLSMVRVKMNETKEPFSIANILISVAAEITKMKAKFALIDGGKHFGSLEGSRAVLELVD